jgi:DNA mismatch repair protein MutL
LDRINVLNEDTSNKIAAGEVVERPYSVVKELIENSIDANSKNITVEIFEGGQKSIRITDDGIGIHPEDIEKAFMPHATSKIKTVEDIFKIATMGFRGEALASIGAISNTVLKSRTADYSYGRELSLSGGKLNYITDTGMNIGTSIEVNDIFFNVPARMKFLKSPMREGASISDIVSRIAMAHSNISFKLFNNDKKVVHTYGNNNIIDSIRSIYGKNTTDNLIYFENHSDTATIYGYVGNSEISRGSRNNQTIFVNKRYIKSRLITAAVETAFKSFLTINKFPFFVIFLDIFPEFIDVNIHPTKAEVKFRDDREIFKLIFDGVHAAIKNSLKDTFDIDFEKLEFKEKTNYEKIDYFDVIDNSKKKEEQKFSAELPLDLKNTDSFISSLDNNKAYSKNIDRDNKNTYIEERSAADNKGFYNNSCEEKIKEVKESYEREPEELKVAKFPNLDVIGQFNNTYILAQSMGELYIIDQHAAHEKILFEKYRNEINLGEINIQLLLTPLVMELNSEDYYYYIENEEIFKTAGFTVEIFGDNTITIREIPYFLGKLDIKNFFLAILDNLKNMGSGKTTVVKYDSIAKMACKSAIKANDRLSIAELNSLIEELRYLAEPFNCPHGRPTIIKMTLQELEKKFKRIQ